MAWRGPTTQSNTNPVPNRINYDQSMSDMKIGNNRAHDVRRDTDDQKDFSVTLLDIDTTIYNHLNERINPTVIDTGRVIKVPVNFASQEKWKSITKDGYVRDKNGKIQCPLIAMRRSTMQRNDNLVTLNRYLQYPTIKQFSQKNQYDKFSAMVGFNPVKEIYSVALPDHVIINYEFIAWTDYNTQQNSVVEQINFATEDYWGVDRFKFRTSISDYQFQIETPADGDRIVKTTFTLLCYAYLLPDKFENYKSTVQKSFTPRKIVFNTETIESFNQMTSKQSNSQLP